MVFVVEIVDVVVDIILVGLCNVYSLVFGVSLIEDLLWTFFLLIFGLVIAVFLSVIVSVIVFLFTKAVHCIVFEGVVGGTTLLLLLQRDLGMNGN